MAPTLHSKSALSKASAGDASRTTTDFSVDPVFGLKTQNLFKKVKIDCVGQDLQLRTLLLPKHYQNPNQNSSRDEDTIFLGSFDRTVEILQEDIEFDPETQVMVFDTPKGRMIIKNERLLESAIHITADKTEWPDTTPYLCITIVEKKSSTSNPPPKKSLFGGGLGTFN